MYSPFMQHGAWGFGMAGAFAGIALIIVLWTVVWKGLALWNAARNRQFWWFAALLIINTAGVLEIVYLLFFRADKDERPFSSLVSMPRAKKEESTKAEDLPVAESSPAE